MRCQVINHFYLYGNGRLELLLIRWTIGITLTTSKINGRRTTASPAEKRTLNMLMSEKALNEDNAAIKL